MQATNNEERVRDGSATSRRLRRQSEAAGAGNKANIKYEKKALMKGGGDELRKGVVQKRKQLGQLGHQDQQRKQWRQLQQGCTMI